MTIDQEEKWRAEFEDIGETALRHGMQHGGGVGVGITDEPKRQSAFRWLRQREREQEQRDAIAQWYAKWTFWAAVLAAVIGLIGVGVTAFHG